MCFIFIYIIIIIIIKHIKLQFNVKYRKDTQYILSLNKADIFCYYLYNVLHQILKSSVMSVQILRNEN